MAFNWSKIKHEAAEYGMAWLDGDDTATHAGGKWVNRFVEGARFSPYTSGHVDAFVWPLCLLETMYLLWRWLT